MLEWLATKLAGKAIASVIPWKWVGIVGFVLALAFLILWLLWSKAELKAENAQLAADNSTLQTSNDSLSQAKDDLLKEKAALEDALAERDTTITTINADREAMRRRWQEAIRNEQEVRDWADTPLPDAVRGMLQ